MEIHEKDIHGPDRSTAKWGQLFLASVPTGFPSPADDYIEQKLDLNAYLIKHPAATFFVRVSGDSMVGVGIHSGDILIVDRALEPASSSVVIARLDGELTVKQLRKQNGKFFLVAENRSYETIEAGEETDFEIWGVVTNVIHSL